MKWVGPYTPEDYNPDTGEYEKAGNALDAYTILDMNASFQVWKRINLGFGIRNAGDYIHERYGPFIGRSMFIEISTTI
jgi:outer membrane receptor for ferrienterochelin and colicin|tara:strand:- start:1032 stop:1265 length:234 start_codon:yes stop_codon:yes gene_type:complete